jgi:nicotinamide riboside transporter PnuC
MIPENVLETVGLVASILAIVGVVLNNARRRSCFPVWWASNVLFAAIHLSTSPVVLTMVGRDLIFLALAISGFYQWRKARTVVEPLSERIPTNANDKGPAPRR